MKNKYIDLIEQTFEFPQDEFKVEDGELHFSEGFEEELTVEMVNMN